MYMAKARVWRNICIYSRYIYGDMYIHIHIYMPYPPGTAAEAPRRHLGG